MAEAIAGEPFPELEHLCPVCDGSGVDRKDPPRWFCPRCNGAGYLPTEIGKKVLALIRHNGIELQAAISAARKGT